MENYKKLAKEGSKEAQLFWFKLEVQEAKDALFAYWEAIDNCESNPNLCLHISSLNEAFLLEICDAQALAHIHQLDVEAPDMWIYHHHLSNEVYARWCSSHFLRGRQPWDFPYHKSGEAHT